MSTQAYLDNAKSRPSPSWLQRMAANFGFPPKSGLRQTLGRAIEEADSDEDIEDPLSAQERTMLLNMLGFGGLRVAETMVPRADIIAICEDETLDALLRLFSEAGHSRLPVYRSSLDDPVGMVHIRDAVSWATRQATPPLPAGSAPSASAALDLSRLDLTKTIAGTGLTREVLFVPSSMPALDLLAKMRAKKIHLALVMDEFGGTDGLVSIEDLVEEIVGDIDDEHDTDEDPVIGEEGEAFVASARTPIEEVEQVLGVTLTAPGATEEVHTLGGLIMAMVGFVPKRGHIVSHPSGIDFEVLEAGPRRIHKVRIVRHRALHAPQAPLLLPAPGVAPDGETVDAGSHNTRAA